MPDMSTIKLDLGRITVSEPDIHVQIKTKADIHVAMEDSHSRDASQILHRLQHKDMWCSRRFPIKMILGFSFDLAISLTAARNQQLQLELIQMLENARIWQELGLELTCYNGEYDERAPDVDKVAVHADLVEPNLYHVDTQSRPHTIDPSSIQCPHSVVSYNVRSINIEWHFAALKASTSFGKPGDLSTHGNSMIDFRAITPSVDLGLAKVIGLARPYKSAKKYFEEHNVIKLIDLAPSVFKHGFSQQIMERMKLMEPVSRSLAKFVRNFNDKRCERHETGPAWYPTNSKMDSEGVLQHLWMTTTNAFTVMPSPRLLPPVPGNRVRQHSRPIGLLGNRTDTASSELGCREAIPFIAQQEDGWENLLDHHPLSVDELNQRPGFSRLLPSFSCRTSMQQQTLHGPNHNSVWVPRLPERRRPFDLLNLDVTGGEMLFHTDVPATHQMTDVYDSSTDLVEDDVSNDVSSADLFATCPAATTNMCMIEDPHDYELDIDHLSMELGQNRCSGAWENINEDASNDCATSDIVLRCVDRESVLRESWSTDMYDTSDSVQISVHRDESLMYIDMGGREGHCLFPTSADPYRDEIVMGDILIE